MSEKVTCGFCNKVLANKYILTYHQKRTKFCLKIQTEQKENIVDQLVGCEYCNVRFSPAIITRHTKNCLTKLRDKIEDQETLIKEQQEEIVKLRLENAAYKRKITELSLKPATVDISKPEILTTNSHNITTTTNNITNITNNTTNNTTNNNGSSIHVVKNTIINNFTPLNLGDTDDIKAKINANFTVKHFMDGHYGVQDFLICNIMVDNDGLQCYGCTDTSRQIFKYKDPSGKISTDPKAQKLIDAVYKPILDKIDQIIPEIPAQDGMHTLKKRAEIRRISQERGCPGFRSGLATKSKIG